VHKNLVSCSFDWRWLHCSIVEGHDLDPFFCSPDNMVNNRSTTKRHLVDNDSGAGQRDLIIADFGTIKRNACLTGTDTRNYAKAERTKNCGLLLVTGSLLLVDAQYLYISWHDDGPSYTRTGKNLSGVIMNILLVMRTRHFLSRDFTTYGPMIYRRLYYLE